MSRNTCIHVVDDKLGPYNRANRLLLLFAAATFTLAAATASVTAAQYSAMDKQNKSVATAAKASTTTAAAATASVATASVTAASVATASVTAATASSQPNRGRGRPKQTDGEAKKSRILRLQKMKQRDAAKRSKLEAEGGVEAARSKATSQKKASARN